MCRISEEDLDSFLTSLTAAADYDTFLKVRQGFHCIGPFVTRTLCQLFGQFMSELFIPFSSLYFGSGGTLGHWKEPDMMQSAITPTLQKFDSGRWCWTMDWDNRRGFHAVSAVSSPDGVLLFLRQEAGILSAAPGGEQIQALKARLNSRRTLFHRTCSNTHFTYLYIVWNKKQIWTLFYVSQKELTWCHVFASSGGDCSGWTWGCSTCRL